MPKLKTKSAAKKRFSFTASNNVVSQPAYRRHLMKNKSQKMKRRTRGTMVLSKSDVKSVVKYMPYK